jgi:hypothetical protein
MRRYGPYEPLEVLVKQKNATVYRARGPRGYAVLVVFEPGARARPRDEVAFTAWASADPQYYAFEVPAGPTDEEQLTRALLRLDRASELMYKLPTIEFLRAKPESRRERLWRKTKSASTRAMSTVSEVATAAVRGARRTGQAVSAAVSRAIPVLGRAMPAVGTLSAIIASIAVVVTTIHTLPRMLQRLEAIPVEKSGQGDPGWVGLPDHGGTGAASLARLMPTEPFRDQLRAPCLFPSERPGHSELPYRVIIRGGCWRRVDRRPPCGADYEYEDGCYAPIHKDPISKDPNAARPEWEAPSFNQ